MNVFLKKLLAGMGLRIVRIPKGLSLYDDDQLVTLLNHDFVRDSRFIDAHRAGVATGEMFPGKWRFHVAMWAARRGTQLEGDFVECGVNTGSLSVAALTYVGWNSLEKSAHLFDTWTGLDETQLTPRERELSDHRWRESYDRDVFDKVKENFRKFDRVNFYRGAVPNTLSAAKIEKISYLSIDMNCMQPEIAAAEYFWEKMSPGAVLLLDDYGFNGPHQVQKEAFDEFASARGCSVLSLPTGQGIIIR